MRLVCRVVEAKIEHHCAILNFQTPFFKKSGSPPYFSSILLKIHTASYEHVEVASHEVSCGSIGYKFMAN